MKKITLTDKDGIEFEIEVAILKGIFRTDSGSTVHSIQDEQISVKKSLEEICRKVIQ